MSEFKQKLGESYKLIEVKSVSAGFQGGNFARILINNKPVKVNMNQNGHMRGLHVVVINR